MKHPDLDRLWSLAKREARRSRTTIYSVFGSIGLYLRRPLKRMGYWCTPQGALTFAETCGDGVHFSFLPVPDLQLKDWPVVMTVPAPVIVGDHNYILGRNLGEFLGLGYYRGCFALEQLAYKPEEALSYHSTPDPQAPNPLLGTLVREMNLEPWKDMKKRLATLERRYLRYVKVEEP